MGWLISDCVKRTSCLCVLVLFLSIFFCFDYFHTSSPNKNGYKSEETIDIFSLTITKNTKQISQQFSNQMEVISTALLGSSLQSFFDLLYLKQSSFHFVQVVSPLTSVTSTPKFREECGSKLAHSSTQKYASFL